jgi:hypothetical protein
VLRAAERRREEQQRQLELELQQQQQQQQRELEQQQQHETQEQLRAQGEAEEEAAMEEERLRRELMEDQAEQELQEHLEHAAEEQEQEQGEEDNLDEDGEDEVRRAEAQALLDAEEARLAAEEATALTQMSPSGKQELDADDAFSVGGGAETEATSPLGHTSNTLESALAAERDQLAEMEHDLDAAEAQALDPEELEHKDDCPEMEEAAAAASAAFDQMTAQFVQASIAKAIAPNSRSSSDARPSSRVQVPVSARSLPAPEPGEPELDLIYDPILDCFYCPKMDKYFRKKR